MDSRIRTVIMWMLAWLIITAVVLRFDPRLGVYFLLVLAVAMVTVGILGSFGRGPTG